MLADRVEVWSKDLLDRGRREGEAKLLLRQLERKLEAGRLEDVFEG